MEFGIVRETTPQERRVPLTPEGVRALVEAGHSVHIETGTGLGSGYSDTEYLGAGAQLAFSAQEVVGRCDVLAKVHAPNASEIGLLHKGQTLTGFLHLASAPQSIHDVLQRQQITTLSLENVREEPGEYPILEPLSALGGRVAVALAAYHLTAPGGGQGILLGGATGVPPAMVLVIGGGSAGEAAASEAAALGAQVVVLDRDPRRLAQLDRSVGKVAVTAISSEYHLTRYIEQADVVIGAVALKNQPAPKVLRKHHIRLMKEGSLFIDMSIDEGGCAETSRPTTPEAPVYESEGVRHICIPNLPSEVARTASRTLGSCLLPYLFQIGEGIPTALSRSDALRFACSYYQGKLVNRALRHKLPDVRQLAELDQLVPRDLDWQG